MFENLPDDEAAIQADQRLSELETAYRRNFVERGILLLTCRQRRLWTLIVDPVTALPFHSFEAWVVRRTNHSRSDCYAALRAVEELKDIPAEELADIPRTNIEELRKLSTAVRRDPQVLEAARSQSKDGFLAHIEKNHPDQHPERTKELAIKCPRSQYDAITAALDVAMTYYSVSTYADALEAIVAEWKQERTLQEDLLKSLDGFALDNRVN